MRTVLLLLLTSVAFADCKIYEVIPTLKPNAEWSMRGNTYEGLEWLDASQKKPTAQEVAAAVETCESALVTRENAKRLARFTVRSSTTTAAQKINSLILLMDMDR